MTEEEVERHQRGQRFVGREVEVFNTQEEADAFVLAHSQRLNQVYVKLGLPPLYPEVKEIDDDSK